MDEHKNPVYRVVGVFDLFIFKNKQNHEEYSHDDESTGRPKTAHSLLVMFNLPAAIIFGIFPGISIPPAMRRPSKIARMVSPSIAGLTSAAARVALSKYSRNHIDPIQERWTKTKDIFRN